MLLTPFTRQVNLAIRDPSYCDAHLANLLSAQHSILNWKVDRHSNLNWEASFLQKAPFSYSNRFHLNDQWQRILVPDQLQ